MNIEGQNVLVLEDEIIIAFALEDMLLDMGAVVVIASTVEEGFASIEKSDFTLAILDVNVNGVKSYPLAEELHRRSVPIGFATGYGGAEHPAQFASAPTLTKPYTKAQLAEFVENMA